MSEDEWERVEFKDLRVGDTIRAEWHTTETIVRSVITGCFANRVSIAGLDASIWDDHSWRFWRLRPPDLPEPIEPGTVVEAADHARYALMSCSVMSPLTGDLEWWPISETHPKIIGEYCNWSHIEQPAKIIGRLRFESIGGES